LRERSPSGGQALLPILGELSMKMHSARLESTLATTRLDDEHGQGRDHVAPGDAPSTTDHGERGDILVAREVARLLRMNVKTVYELAKAGSLPSVRLGRHFRFSRRAIVGAFVAKSRECKAAPYWEGK
jgi:excisionase family DNA binding protein